MLFRDDKLSSEFDFGNTISDGNASLKCLANEIFRISQVIKDQKDPICFKHTDNNNNLLYLQMHQSKGENNIYERSPEEILQLLYRKRRASTISGFLVKMGIEKPEEGTSAFKEYLQLLYFFYMMRNYIFENDSFFRMFTNTPTSELSPVEGASQGKYIWFILSNLMDDKESCEIFLSQDFAYSTLISIITDKINDYITEDSLYENEERAKEIERVINECDGVLPCKWQGGIILRTMNSLYQYQMLGYSGDMIRNLTGKESVFNFPELEIEASLDKWGERYLKYDQIEIFLKEKEVAVFCTQNYNLERPDKALRNGPTEIAKFVFQEDKKRDNHIFVHIGEEGEAWISALMVAVIARTYIDLGKEKLLVNIKKRNGWNYDVAFKNALASSNGISRARFATDLAYRLFIVAVHSEFLNTTKGHGYWPVLFQPIYLRNYIYVQSCVNHAFSGLNPNEWRNRLYYFVYNLPDSIQNES